MRQDERTAAVNGVVIITESLTSGTLWGQACNWVVVRQKIWDPWTQDSAKQSTFLPGLFLLSCFCDHLKPASEWDPGISKVRLQQLAQRRRD
ncbi:uncharacterized protein LOC141726923 isoform X2 [Zonotrichia albicollis]|uniref:uncharacterized protein LOC141726923 isoform X2 n=1 Tax=Zonotrichia albicollis TaxID=44394 RepID=UPI003D80CC9F